MIARHLPIFLLLLLLLLTLSAASPRKSVVYHLWLESVPSLSVLNKVVPGTKFTEKALVPSSIKVLREISQHGLVDGDEWRFDEQASCDDSPRDGSRCWIDFSRERDDTNLRVSGHLYADRDDGRWVLQLDATSTSFDALAAKEVLVGLVSSLTLKFRVGTEDIAWSIHERKGFSSKQHGNRASSESSVSSAMQAEELRASSVDTIILSDPSLRDRVSLYSGVSPGGSRIEVWQYVDDKFKDPVRALFVDGLLRTTTAPAGTAHAEALVHPAMTSHPSPSRVLIISLEPTRIVKEVSKHIHVDEIVVLGAEPLAMEKASEFLAVHDDCDFLRSDTRSCIQQHHVQTIDDPVESWLEDLLAARIQPDADDWCDGKECVDVIFIDVPIGAKSEWLDVRLIRNLIRLMMAKSLIVIGTGSPPPLFDAKYGRELSPRDALLRQLNHYSPGDSLDLGAVLVYDEHLAKPFPSSFFAFFMDTEESTHLNFIRSNAPAIEVDMVAKLYDTATPAQPFPTLVYDGSTHRGYQTPSRAWEQWFCKSGVGEDMPICKDFLRSWFDSSRHRYDFEVRNDPVKGRSLYATSDISEGEFVLPNDAAMSLQLDQQQWDALVKFADDFPEANMYGNLVEFYKAYGYEAIFMGKSGWAVSLACNATFTNHACSDEELGVTHVKGAFLNPIGEECTFSPPLLRKSTLFGTLAVAVRDIPKGEEVLADYSVFRQHETPEYNKLLRDMCHRGVGLVPSRKEEEDGDVMK